VYITADEFDGDFHWFSVWVRGWRAIRREYLKLQAAGGFQPRGWDFVIQLAERWGVGAGNVAWTFYH
jgi:hypothetical protein